MMNNQKVFLLSFLVALWPSLLSCQPGAKIIPFDLSSLLEHPCYETASVTFMLYDLEGDTIIEGYQPLRALPPASTQKILTTAAGLLTLGEQFQFETGIYIAGNIEGSTLQGDLMIKGFGDPTLASTHFTSNGFTEVFETIFRMLADKGIVRITGDIVADASFYPKTTIPRSWPYLHLGNYYGAFPAGLNFFDNQHFLEFRQRSTPGEEVLEFSIHPHVPDLSLQSLVRTGVQGSGDEAYIMGGPFQTNRYVQGTIPPGNGTFSIKGSLPDPALFMAYHLKDYLQNNGLQLDGSYRSLYEKVDDGLLLGVIKSPPLREITAITNQKSVNLFAEAIGLHCMRNLEMESEDWLVDFWKAKGIEMRGCHFYDFAGLAPDNALSASAMIEILRFIRHDGSIWPVFLNTLAVGGESGTLRSMFMGSQARGNVFAKSGLINGVRSFAGYMRSSSGKWYAFAVLTHNPACNSGSVRHSLETWMEKIYQSLP